MSECAEHDRCIQRDKAECEWCQNPAVVQDAQRWRNDLQRVYEGYFGSESKSFKRLAAHIERLEDLLNGYRGLYDDAVDEYASLKAERDALHDALRWCSGSADFAPGGQAREGWQRQVAPLLAERMIRNE